MIQASAPHSSLYNQGLNQLWFHITFGYLGIHKTHFNGSFEWYKDRLVGDGKTQHDGIDCYETLSPIVKPFSSRLVFRIALAKFWFIHQLDIKNTSLHGHLNGIVYMYKPLGFCNIIHPNLVFRLRKSLYGHKQAPCVWYQWFADFVTTIVFKYSIMWLILFSLPLLMCCVHPS